MGYHEFRAQWRRAMDDAADSGLRGGTAQVARLRTLAGTIPDPYERRSAEAAVRSLEGVLRSHREPFSAEVADAYRLSAWANSEGEPAEWLARIGEAIRKIGELANRAASRDDKSEILGLNEPLAMLIDSLRHRDRIPGR
jgi:hypothetical protein